MLRDEHVVIGKAVYVLEALADRALGGGAVPREHIDALLRFFRVYADANHHAKEEGVLFPEIKLKGVEPEQGALAILEGEHDKERDLVKELNDTAAAMGDDYKSRARFAASAELFAAFQRQHMRKENTVLFPVVDQLLTAEDEPRILAAYERYERQERDLAELERELEELMAIYLD